MTEEKKSAAASEADKGGDAEEKEVTAAARQLMSEIAERDFPVPPEIDKKTGLPKYDRTDIHLSYQPCHDHGNAQRFLKRNDKKIIYVEKNGWFGWADTHWSFEDGERRAEKAAYNTALAMKKEALAYAARGEFDGEKETQYRERLKKFRAFTHTSCNLAKLNAMLRIAQTYVAKAHDIMDTHKYLVTVDNGMLDLKPAGKPRSVTLLKHDPDKFISKKMDVKYDPEAKCPLFLEKLAQILPDDGDREFLRQWYGYCLTGSVAAKAILIMQGKGDNGKSLLIELFNDIFGNYACGIPIESLMAQKNKSGANASPDLARLPGARVVTAAEPDEGMQFSEGFLKTISGSDTMTVRRLHEDFFEFIAQFKLTLSCNAKPQVRGGDQAFWNRINIIVFEQKFLPTHKMSDPPQPNEHPLDPDLREKLWAERSGILNWMISGMYDFLERGLQPSDKMKAAVAEYRAENNSVLQFIDAWCSKDPGSERATDLFDAYELWAKESAIEPMTKVGFGKKIKTVPFIKPDRQGTGMYYQGVRLNSYAHEKLQDHKAGRTATRAPEKATAGAADPSEYPDDNTPYEPGQFG